MIADIRRPSFLPTSGSEHPGTPQSAVEARLAGASIAIVKKVVIDAAMLDRLPALRMIAVAATGTNTVDPRCLPHAWHRCFNIRSYAVHTVRNMPSH